MTVPLVTLAVLAVVSSGWRGPTDGWFSRFVAPYDMARIVEESPARRTHGEVHADPAAAHDEHALPQEPHGRPRQPTASAHDGATTRRCPPHRRTSRPWSSRSWSPAWASCVAWLTYIRGRISASAALARLPRVHHVLQHMYFFDEFYAATVYRFTLWFSWLYGAFDRLVIDGIVNGMGYLTRVLSWFAGLADRYVVDGLVNGVGAVIQGAGEGFRRVQTGRVQSYLAYACFSVLLLVFVFRAL